MTVYIIKRLLLALFTLLAILFSSYLLLRLTPGDPTRSNMFSDTSGGGTLDAKNNALYENRSLREKLDLDKPVLTGFSRWLKKIVCNGDFGTSVMVDKGKSVTSLIGERLSVTLKLNCAAIFIIYLCSIPLGIFSASKAGGFFDRSSEFLLFVLYSLPVMWVGLLLKSLLCEGGTFPIFPLGSLTPDDPEQLTVWQYQWQSLKHYTLPVICLAYGGIAGLSRYTRGSMLEVMNCDYIRTARAKGVGESGILWGHAFRNALITMITLFGSLLPSLVGGSVLVEYIFDIPGMGTLALDSLSQRDYPLQMALFAFTGVLTLAGILLSDILYTIADPRIRLE